MGSKICSQLICILSAHFQLGFSSKLKCPSSARLGSENFQLGLARAGKFQLEPITTSHGAMLALILIGLFTLHCKRNKTTANFYVIFLAYYCIDRAIKMLLLCFVINVMTKFLHFVFWFWLSF